MVKTKSPSLENKLIERIVASIAEKKGNDITVIDLQGFDHTIADFFVIADATTHIQVKAIADHIERQVSKALKIRPAGVEGEENAQWILLDYGDVIVHVFQQPVREYYDIEGLWADAPIQKIEQ